MEFYPLCRPRFQRHKNFYLIYMDLKSPLDDIKRMDMFLQAYFQESLVYLCIQRHYFVSISNLFLREFILIWAIIILLEWCFRILNKKSVQFLYFCDSPCIPLSVSLLPCILFYRKIWHNHWILRGGKRKIFFAFYSFLIQVVR